MERKSLFQSNTCISDMDWFYNCTQNTQLMKILSHIRLIITDIDGSLTDGTVYLTEAAQKELKEVSMEDHYGMEKFLENKLDIAFVSGRKSNAFKKYAKSLGIPANLYYQDAETDKTKFVKKIQKLQHRDKKETLFYGDDMLDFETQPFVAIFCAPCNAPFYIQSYAGLVIPKSGGKGAFRLLLDLILFAQKKHFAQDLITQLLHKY